MGGGDRSAIDGGRLLARLDELAASARSPGGGPGVTRLAWSAEDRTARALLASWVDLPGVVLSTDAATNVMADWAGSDTGLAPLVMGSHLDTVVDGGPLDGAYGTAAAFEIVAGLAASGERLRHPVRAVAWANEEGVVAPPFTGSRAAAGRPVDVAVVLPDGRTLAEVLIGFGGDPHALVPPSWPAPAAYLELHIEQGPVLDDRGVPIGVVTAIAGSRRGVVTITGRANHAGTTPMDRRADALVAAATLVIAIEELATRGPADVATVGSLVTEPGNGNVIPGRVVLTYDVRSERQEDCDAAFAALVEAVATVAAASGTTVELTALADTAAVPTAGPLRAVVADAARALGLPTLELASGAGHDAQHLAAIGPMAMIFIPTAGGVSHHPEETARPGDVVAGAATLLAALRLADERLGP